MGFGVFCGFVWFSFCDWKKPQKHSQKLISFDLTLLCCPQKDSNSGLEVWPAMGG